MSYRFDVEDLTGEERALVACATGESTATMPERARLGSAKPTEDLTLWHKRLGHRNKRDLGYAISHGLLTGPQPEAARNKKSGLCDECVKSKSTRHSFERAVSGKIEKVPRKLQPKNTTVSRTFIFSNRSWGSRYSERIRRVRARLLLRKSKFLYALGGQGS